LPVFTLSFILVKLLGSALYIFTALVVRYKYVLSAIIVGWKSSIDHFMKFFVAGKHVSQLVLTTFSSQQGPV
jgi:hypothetical protein